MIQTIFFILASIAWMAGATASYIIHVENFRIFSNNLTGERRHKHNSLVNYGDPFWPNGQVYFLTLFYMVFWIVFMPLTMNKWYDIANLAEKESKK